MTLAICLSRQCDILINDFCIVSLIQYLSSKNVLNGKAFYSSAAAKHKTKTGTEQTGSDKENKANAKVFCISTFSTLQLSVVHITFFSLWTHRTETDFQYIFLLYIK